MTFEEIVSAQIIEAQRLALELRTARLELERAVVALRELAAERDKLASIVRRFAAASPLRALGVREDYCGYCGLSDEGPEPRHAPACLWQHAQRWAVEHLEQVR